MMGSINKSKFYMWRTLFAIAHVDDNVSAEEIRFMTGALEDLPFTSEQMAVLEKDIVERQDVVEMFTQIDDPNDQAAFFKFAREMVWVDGDYGEEEQEIMLKLKQEHVKHVDVDKLVDGLEMELESDSDAQERAENAPGPERSWKNKFFSFRKRFQDNL